MNCETCGCMFDVSAHEAEMYRRFGFPPENICFECSAKHKIAFRNGRNMYRRKCDATGEDILSIYSPDKPFQVYKSGAWYSDSWDGLDYGTEYDFSRSFFDQFAALKLRVPRLALTNMQAENSEYCNMTYGNKNCYLVFGGDFNEDTMFGTLCMHNRSCLDCDFSNYNELCCEVSDCIRCYGCWFAFDCANCTDCALISDCTACQDCILCCNLVQRRWCVRNKQLSKEEYAAEKAKLLDGSYTSQRRCTDELRELRQRRIVKHSHLVSCENVSGGYIKNSRNCFNAYDVSDSEDVVDAVFAIEAKDCFRCALIGHGSEQCFNMMSVIRSVDSACCFMTADCSSAWYSDCVINCGDVFGCVSLRHKRYCILNKQYSASAYHELREKIVQQMKARAEWGRFFPKSMSCFAYNESTAQDYYPLNKVSALREGFSWKEEEKGERRAPTCVPDDRIQEVADSITREVLQCLACGGNYRITAQEFKFYRAENIPVPRDCPNCRHLRRLHQRNPRKLFVRNCAKCGGAIESTYAPERTEVVYCESCFQQAVY